MEKNMEYEMETGIIYRALLYVFLRGPYIKDYNMLRLILRALIHGNPKP